MDQLTYNQTVARKSSGRVSIGRKGAQARAMKRTPEARSESARKAVPARLGKGKGISDMQNNTGKKPSTRNQIENIPAVDTSDMALTNLLERLRSTSNPDEIRQLSEQIERVVFHKQFANA